MNVEELQAKFCEYKKNHEKSTKPEAFNYIEPFIASLPLNNESRPGVLYSRISTNYQNDGFSLEHQEKAMIDYCEKNNIYIIEKYSEVVSGGSMERMELKRLLSSLKPGYCVICNAVSRLSRNLEDLLSINRQIKEKKSSLILLDIGVDSSTPNGKLLISLIGSISEIEKTTISGRVTAVMQHLKATNQLVCKPHYGWKMGPHGLEKKEDE